MMIDEDPITHYSREALAQGLRILQGFRLAPTDRGHVVELLDHMTPAHGSLWADIGCGFGEVADIMSQLQPDLGFVLINNNRFQLEQAPNRFLQLCVDMHDIPLPDACVDGCMFLYSLCHSDGFASALWEAARITRQGGVLFVFDYERLAGDNDLMKQRLDAWAIPFSRMRGYAELSEWDITMHITPRGDDEVFRRFYGGDLHEYTLIFQDLMPVIWKAVRR